jgi:hypothetical protein
MHKPAESFYKIAISILLLGVILLEACGSYVLPGLYQAAVKYTVKKQIRQGIPDAKICRITISSGQDGESNGGFCLNDDNECWYGGKLYDILSVREHHGSRIYYCLLDEKETAVATWFMSLIKQKFSTTEQNSPATVFLHHISTLFCTAPGEVATFLSATVRLFTWLPAAVNDHHLIPFTPPPEQLQ